MHFCSAPCSQFSVNLDSLFEDVLSKFGKFDDALPNCWYYKKRNVSLKIVKTLPSLVATVLSCWYFLFTAQQEAQATRCRRSRAPSRLTQSCSSPPQKTSGQPGLEMRNPVDASVMNDTHWQAVFFSGSGLACKSTARVSHFCQSLEDRCVRHASQGGNDSK